MFLFFDLKMRDMQLQLPPLVLSVHNKQYRWGEISEAYLVSVILSAVQTTLGRILEKAVKLLHERHRLYPYKPRYVEHSKNRAHLARRIKTSHERVVFNPCASAF